MDTKILTRQMLNSIAPDAIFATGEAVDGPDGINMTGSGHKLRWVAVRGAGIPDWTIYCHWAEHNIAWIRRFGDKVIRENHIRRCVECDDEAFQAYRY